MHQHVCGKRGLYAAIMHAQVIYAEKTQTEKSVIEQTQKIDSPRILSLYYYALS